MLECSMIYLTMVAMLIIVIGLIRSNNIMTITLLNGAFSLFMVMMYLLLDAPDVAMTEAAVSILASVFSVYTIKHVYKYNFIFVDNYNIYLLIAIGVFAAVLIYVSGDLPDFGQARFNSYYLDNSMKDTGVPSVVASILASYRGYDTLLETLVVLLGSLAILMISGNENKINKLKDEEIVSRDVVITKVTRFILPLILLFSFYIQFHGEVSPGGGFQAGAIIAASIILYAMAFGEENLLSVISIFKLKIIAVIGVIIYISVGLVGFIKKSSFLDYNILAVNQVMGQKIGIVMIEIGVGITVSAAMLIIYLSLAYASNES